jgi:hypothetical protein
MHSVEGKRTRRRPFLVDEKILVGKQGCWYNEKAMEWNGGEA